jgi:hypothetical protein
MISLRLKLATFALSVFLFTTNIVKGDTFYTFNWTGTDNTNIVGQITVNTGGFISDLSGTVTWAGSPQTITGFTSPQNTVPFIGPSPPNVPFFSSSSSLDFTTSSAEYTFLYNGITYSLINSTLPENAVFGTNAQVTQVPEINSGSLPKAILLLGSFYLLLTQRKKSAANLASDENG